MLTRSASSPRHSIFTSWTWTILKIVIKFIFECTQVSRLLFSASLVNFNHHHLHMKSWHMLLRRAIYHIISLSYVNMWNQPLGFPNHQIKREYFYSAFKVLSQLLLWFTWLISLLHLFYGVKDIFLVGWPYVENSMSKYLMEELSHMISI